MINSNFGFTPLREVWLGDVYPDHFYDHLPNEIADPFRQITEWTKQDLNKLQKFLESQNIQVHRPQFESIDDFINSNDQLVKPPITPRDDYLVLGQTLYSLHNKLKKDPWRHTISEYELQGLDVQQPSDDHINYLIPPSVVRIGRDLVVNYSCHQPNWNRVSKWLTSACREYRINLTEIGEGHNDGMYCPIKEGLIVSSKYTNVKDFSCIFPGWEIIKFDQQEMKCNKSLSNQWRVNHSEIDNNQAFGKHIVKNSQDWIGNFQETVYEINMLVLDQHNVVVTTENLDLFKKLSDHGVTPHVFNFKTSEFWDGGWHCLTLDIHREDEKIDLFPQREKNGIYWRNN